MSRSIAATAADPTYPKTPVTVGGQVYNLCFDLGALAEAEEAINAELAAEYTPKLAAAKKARRPAPEAPEYVNLLRALPVLNLANTRVLFAAAVRKFHPDIPFAEAVKMLRVVDVFTVAQAIAQAVTESMPEPEGGDNPPQPGE